MSTLRYVRTFTCEYCGSKVEISSDRPLMGRPPLWCNTKHRIYGHRERVRQWKKLHKTGIKVELTTFAKEQPTSGQSAELDRLVRESAENLKNSKLQTTTTIFQDVPGEELSPAFENLMTEANTVRLQQMLNEMKNWDLPERLSQ